jgi:uncharacterized protein (TIGR01627 family)
MHLLTIKELKKTRKELGIQIRTNQLLEIVKTIEKKRPANFLVYGIGNDSIFWHHLNKSGRTVFIESDESWFSSIKSKHPKLASFFAKKYVNAKWAFSNIKKEYPFLEAYLVEYGTKRSEWKNLINFPEKLHLNLPKNVLKTKWDIILVDAPPGLVSVMPGRMKSIYMSSVLTKKDGDIFVHDCHREVEKTYCNKYLTKKELINEIGLINKLRHYR